MVSVVIPTFNRQHLLADAVASCLAQTHPQLEVLIIDDGSTDGTDAFVNDQLAKEWKGRVIRYFKKPNGGPAAARQYGLERAEGEFVQFLDSDDLILPVKIERQVAALQAADLDAACCSCYGRKGPKNDGWEKAARIGFHGITASDYVRAMCLPINFPMSCIAPLWRKSYLAVRKGWPEDLCCSEDWAYYTRLLAGARAVAFVDDDLFWARDHAGERASATRRRGKGNLRKMLSSAKAIQIVELCVRDAGFFDRETQAGLLHISRSVYSLFLEAGAEEEIKAFEDYTGRLASNPPTFSPVNFAGWFRALFGTPLTRWAVRRYTGANSGA
jgi:glycosyltransferase involved in cell wall biosynthesis